MHLQSKEEERGAKKEVKGERGLGGREKRGGAAGEGGGGIDELGQIGLGELVGINQPAMISFARLGSEHAAASWSGLSLNSSLRRSRALSGSGFRQSYLGSRGGVSSCRSMDQESAPNCMRSAFIPCRTLHVWCTPMLQTL